MLKKVHKILDRNGLENIINHLINKKLEKKIYTVPTKKEATMLASFLNKACLIYYKKTRCLIWAFTFVFLALKRNWKCNIVIGVQNNPFLSHAWVKYGNKILLDSKEYQNNMAIIFDEPFSGS